MAKPNSILHFSLTCLASPPRNWNSAEMCHKEEPGDRSLETWLPTVVVSYQLCAFGPEPPFLGGFSVSLKPRFELNHQGLLQEIIIVRSTP